MRAGASSGRPGRRRHTTAGAGAARPRGRARAWPRGTTGAAAPSWCACEPTARDDAPPVAGRQAGETPLRTGRHEVVADAALVVEELGRDDDADGVAAPVLGPGRAVAVAVVGPSRDPSPARASSSPPRARSAPALPCSKPSGRAGRSRRSPRCWSRSPRYAGPRWIEQVGGGRDVTTEVRRGALGVPHLRAGDVMEVARLQGRVTALDRGWQVEHHRWRMEGRTAEYVGADGVPLGPLRPPGPARGHRAALLRAARRRDTGMADGIRRRGGRRPRRRALRARPRSRRWASRCMPRRRARGSRGRRSASSGASTCSSPPSPASCSTHVADRWAPTAAPAPRRGRDRRVRAATPGSSAARGPPPGCRSSAETRTGLRVARRLQQVGARSRVRRRGLHVPRGARRSALRAHGVVAWAITNAMADYQDLTIERLRNDGVEA